MRFPFQRASQTNFGAPMQMLRDKWCERCQDNKPEQGFKGWCYDCRREMIVSYLMYRALRFYAHYDVPFFNKARKAVTHYGK